MTPLPNDVCRCNGARAKPDGRVEVCPMVNACRRANGPLLDHTPYAMWLCQSPEFEMRIRPTEKV